MNVLVFVVAIVLAIVIGKVLKTNIGVIALAMAFLSAQYSSSWAPGT